NSNVKNERRAGLTLGLEDTSFIRSTEHHVDDVKCNHAAADHRTGRDCAPKDVGLCKVPNRQQASHDGDQNAGACRPEGDLGDDPWIEEASLHKLPRSYRGVDGTITRSARIAPNSVAAVNRRGRWRASSPTQIRTCNLSGCGSSVVSV